MQALEVFYRVPFAVLEVPNIKLKKPGFVKAPSAMVVFCLILFSYFLVTGGIIYDVIVEPPSIGSVNGVWVTVCVLLQLDMWMVGAVTSV